MHKIVLFVLFAVSGVKAFSQQDYFLYLQSDERLPFYARISNQMYSSSENGYLIIPKLRDSSYQVTIGFARNIYPEQYFAISIGKSDKGYQLKKSGEKGWTLVNLQNAQTIAGVGSVAKTNEDISGVRKTDSFSQMLANVVNDSSILYTSVNVNKPEPRKKKAPSNPDKEIAKAETPNLAKDQPATRTDTLTTTAPVTASAGNKKEPAPPTTAPANAPAEPKITETKTAEIKAPETKTAETKTAETKPVQATENAVNMPDSKPVQPADKSTGATTAATEKPFISRISEEKTEYQYTATYLEQYIYHTDTIRISIPLKEKPAPAEVTTAEKAGTKPAGQQTVAWPSAPPASVPAVDSTTRTTEKVSSVVLLNSDCKNIATEHDVDRLRIKLLADNAIDDKLATARKFYRTRCFTVKQIRALAELFPTDETRYRFFDTSYPFVSDTSNVYQLEDLIQNDYYKNRFKAMIHK